MFGDIELRTAKLRTGVRDAEKQFKHLETTAKHAVTGVERELNRMGKFKANLNQGFMSSFGIQGGGGAGSLIGSAAGNLLQSSGKALFGYVTESIDKGMAMKDLIEQMRIAFTNLTGSEEKAVAHMREMFKFGADTPFQTKDILEYSQQLQAVGFTANEVKQTLTDMGDAMAKAGTFPKMDKAMKAITDMLSKGQVSSEELRGQLGDALPGAFQIASRAMGVESTELTKLMSEGRIDVGPFVKLLLLQMRKESAGTMAKTAGSTLLGLESTLEDAKLMTYATGVTGGDPFGPAGGAYAQLMANKKKQIGMYSGPESAGIATKVGSAAENYQWAMGKIEDNAFKSATGRDTMMKMFTDPKGAASDIYGGLVQGLSSGTGAVSGAISSLSTSMWDTWTGFWESKSPSKRAERLGGWIAEGLEIGLNKRQAGNYAKLQGLSQQDPEFVKKLVAGSVARGINPDHMLNVIAMESSFNAQADNPNSSGYGLIQFMAATRKGMGITQAQLSQMSETEQLDQVFQYFDQPHLKGKLGTQSGLYAAVAAGRVGANDESVLFRKGSAGYNANKVWDANEDGIIRQGELGRVARGALGAGDKFSIAGVPLSASNPMPVAVVNAFAGAGAKGSMMMPAFAGAPDMIGGASSAFAFGGVRASGNSPLAVGGTASINIASLTAKMKTLNEETTSLTMATTVAVKPLTDVKAAMAGMGELDAEMAALRLKAITPDEAKKAKKDKLFDKAFTKEGWLGISREACNNYSPVSVERSLPVY